jgi:hypothetical protein
MGSGGYSIWQKSELCLNRTKHAHSVINASNLWMTPKSTTRFVLLMVVPLAKKMLGFLTGIAIGRIRTSNVSCADQNGVVDRPPHRSAIRDGCVRTYSGKSLINQRLQLVQRYDREPAPGLRQLRVEPAPPRTATTMSRKSSPFFTACWFKRGANRDVGVAKDRDGPMRGCVVRHGTPTIPAFAISSLRFRTSIYLPG